MKYELKIDFKQTEELENVIVQSYFEQNNNGKLIGKKSYLKIDINDPLFTVFKGLNNMTVKLQNDLIDGSMRCVVDENSEVINLYPINNYCIIDSDKKYSFY
jgi:hypothetical protein